MALTSARVTPPLPSVPVGGAIGAGSNSTLLVSYLRSYTSNWGAVRLSVHPPLRVEMLADAIVQAVRDPTCYGIVEGSDIQNQAMWA